MEDERMGKGQTLFFMKTSETSHSGKVVYECGCAIMLSVIVMMVTWFAVSQGDHILFRSTHCCQNLGQTMSCPSTDWTSCPAQIIRQRNIWQSKPKQSHHQTSNHGLHLLLDLQQSTLKALKHILTIDFLFGAMGIVESKLGKVWGGFSHDFSLFFNKRKINSQLSKASQCF